MKTKFKNIVVIDICGFDVPAYLASFQQHCFFKDKLQKEFTSEKFIKHMGAVKVEFLYPQRWGVNMEGLYQILIQDSIYNTVDILFKDYCETNNIDLKVKQWLKETKTDEEESDALEEIFIQRGNDVEKFLLMEFANLKDNEVYLVWSIDEKSFPSNIRESKDWLNEKFCEQDIILELDNEVGEEQGDIELHSPTWGDVIRAIEVEFKKYEEQNNYCVHHMFLEAIRESRKDSAVTDGKKHFCAIFGS